MMHELVVANKRESMLCYYSTSEHRSQAIRAGGMAVVTLANTVYDYRPGEVYGQFTKHRSGRVDLMNMMLEVQRARMEGLITPEMERLVNAHA